MNIELTASPLHLMAVALNTTGVLMGLGATALLVFGYIMLSRNKKETRGERERMLNKTGMNKSMGMIAAIALVLIIMSWTTAYRNVQVAGTEVSDWSGLYPEEVQIFEKQIEQTPPTVEPPKLITDLFKIDDKKEPENPDKTEPKDGTEDGTGKEPVKVIGTPTAPIIKVEPAKVVDEIKVEDPILFAQQMPRFCGCEDKKDMGDEDRKLCADRLLKQYLSKTVRYPDMAISTDCEGKVYMRFVVEKDGSLTNIEVAKDATPGCGLADAAKRAVEKMAKEKRWTPGQQGGNKVRVRITIPIVFKLNG